MNYTEYREQRDHGTFDFPFAFYAVTPAHPRYNMVYHWHMEYEIVRVLKGRLHLHLDGRECVAGAGEVVFVTEGVLHGATPRDCTYECIVFDMNILTKAGSACRPEILSLLNRNIELWHHFAGEAPAVHRHVDEMFAAMGDRRPGYQLTVIGSLYCFLGAALQQGCYRQTNRVSVGGKRRLTQLKTVLSYIRANYHESISLDDLAAHAGMNSNYFCKFFKQMTQKSPMEYVNYYRIECACERLASTDESITQVALGCGFNDVSYFIKTFKKNKGVTPSQYLQAVFG